MDRITKNIAWLALLSLLEALQLMIIIALIGSYIPIPVNDFYYTLFPFIRKGLYQKRDTLYYAVFVSASIVLQAGLIYIYKKFLNNEQAMSNVRSWIAMSAGMLIIQLFLVYQVWLGPNFDLARKALCAACAMGVLARIFWPEFYALKRRIIGRHFVNFTIPHRTIFKNIYQQYKDAIVLIFLTWALCIQVYLFMFAAHGWYSHLDVWPSSALRNYVTLAALCMIMSMAAVWFVCAERF